MNIYSNIDICIYTYGNDRDNAQAKLSGILKSCLERVRNSNHSWPFDDDIPDTEEYKELIKVRT
jgi:hypothetical protein